MILKKFRLSAKVSSDNLQAIKAVLERIFESKGTIKETDKGFEIHAELEGESAVVLNPHFCLNYAGWKRRRECARNGHRVIIQRNFSILFQKELFMQRFEETNAVKS